MSATRQGQQRPAWFEEALDAVDDMLSTDAYYISSGHFETHHIRTLRRVIITLRHTRADARVATEGGRVDDDAETVLARAYGRMAETSGVENAAWRALYSDAGILRALIYLADHGHDDVPDEIRQSNALDAVRALDLVLVLAGAPDRQDLVLDLIERTQTTYLGACSDSPPASPPGSPRTYQPPPSTNLPSAALVVPELSAAPSLGAFTRLHSDAPFILRNFAHDWPACARWRSRPYLRRIAGPGRVVPVEAGADYRTPDWAPSLALWDAFLDALDEKAKVLYLAQHDLLAQFPRLRQDVIVPDYVYARPEDSDGRYPPPGNADGLVVNAWFGPAGTISPPHIDPYFNFYTQVIGHKTVWLAPPVVGTHMYPYMSPHTDDKDATPGQVQGHMSNTSQVDVFDLSPVQSLHPGFWNTVPQQAMAASLAPGDVLFFPPGWWHAMRADEESFSVSMWF